MGIAVLPPDVNHSAPHFRVEGDSIRFGLAAVRGVSEKAAEAISRARAMGEAFRDLADLRTRVDSSVVDASALNALAQAGALDAIGHMRARREMETSE